LYSVTPSRTSRPSRLFRDQRERLANPAVLGFYIALPLIIGHIDNHRAYSAMLPAIAAVAFIAWMLTLRRMLAIDSTPTSKIASAAQGYVELVGRALPHPGGALRSRFTLLPCVWYQYRVEQRQADGKWHTTESGRSDESFLLDDGTGVCLIDPENAEVLPRRTEVMTKGQDYRCTESLILPQEQVYAIGEFSTIGGENTDLNLDRDVSELLSEWKRNKPTLLKRFDLDGDGQISEKEWMLARSQARRDVRKTHNEIRTQPGTNMLHQPRDGRLFLISNIDHEQLGRRYRIWAWLHLFVLIGAVAGTAFFATS
jgi:hypothetical protein